jgi:import inner membrane translocase subunit TIM50
MAKDNRPRFSKPHSQGQSQNKAPQMQNQSQSEPPQRPSQPPPSSSASATASSPKPVPETPKQPSTESTAERTTPQEPAEEPTPDLSKLPDLTQGIPSTLEYETTGATNRSALAALEGEEAARTGGGGARPKGELPASAYVSSTERRRQKWAMWALAAVGASAVVGVAYLGRDWDEEELAKNPEVPNGWSVGLWWKRAMARMGDTVTYYQEPAFEKLLPDPDPSFERPYTLCISLEDMLVHSEWSRDHGWRVAKRPGVDYFLHYLSQYYEIVLFTTVPFANGEPLVRKLDPYRFIMWPLFREATKYKDGEIVKV